MQNSANNEMQQIILQKKTPQTFDKSASQMAQFDALSHMFELLVSKFM